MIMLKDKKYQVILADPPWEYRNKKTGRTNGNQPEGSGAHTKYSTMSLSQTCQLPISNIADRDSVLFLWVTSPMLEDSFMVIRAWGFSYRSSLVWDKINVGIGYWFRGQHELLLVGVKGNFPPPPPELRISSVLRCKRGEHSDKPDHIKHMIDKWYPNATKLELFARDHTPLFESEWDRWGNEVESDVLIT
jgi:N6-adenosine-specific RNA methylase IME4